jgi:hypothetical protein
MGSALRAATVRPLWNRNNNAGEGRPGRGGWCVCLFARIAGFLRPFIRRGHSLRRGEPRRMKGRRSLINSKKGESLSGRLGIVKRVQGSRS